MMALNCETVRDRLPDVLAGAVVGPEAQAVLAHVAECAACADEAALIGALQRSPERAPAALSAHIRQASVRRAWLGRPDLRRSALLAAAVGSKVTVPEHAQEIGAPVYTNPDYGDYPVVGVTWDMAANYCKWAQGSLPSEAQWEKAARGQDGAVYPWGNDNAGCDLLNYKGCLGHASSVNDFPAGRSPYGLLDMEGNVFQWVNDFYDQNYYESMPAQNPPGPAAGETRGVRGASFESDATELLSGIRHFGSATYHSRDLGFRCVVNQPKAFAPYCQSSSYVPSGSSNSTGTCQAPTANVRGNYCAGNSGFTTLQIPPDATFDVTTKGYACNDATVDGSRVLTHFLIGGYCNAMQMTAAPKRFLARAEASQASHCALTAFHCEGVAWQRNA